VLANYVPALTNREQVEKIWARDMATVREMCEVVERLGVTEERPDEVDPNTEACGMYGGCFFRHRCGIGDFSVKNFVASGALSRRTRDTQLAAQGVTSTQTDVAFVATSTRGSEMTFEEKLAARNHTNGAPPPKPSHPPALIRPAAPAPTTMPAHAPALSLEERLKQLPSNIVPEDAPDRDALPGPEVPIPPKRRETKAVAKASEAPTDVAGFFGVDRTKDKGGGVRERSGEEVAALMKAEARDPEASLTLTNLDLDPPSTSSTGASDWERGKVGVPPIAAKAPRPQFTLYIDCFPIKGGHRSSYVLAEEFVAPLMAQVAADHGLPDYRLIPYGGGKAALAQAIRRVMDDVPEALVIGGYAAGSTELLESLIPWATTVIRGK
jgi:hypothetical protein